MLRYLLVVSLVAAMASWAAADVITVNTTADTYIKGGTSYYGATSNKGDESTVSTSPLALDGDGRTDRGLFAFDLTGVAPVINSATLKLFNRGLPLQTFTVYRLTNNNWTEMGATYIHTDKATGTLWATPGGDFDASVSASAMATDWDAYFDVNVTPLVQAMKDAGYTRCGFLVVSTGAVGTDDGWLESKEFSGYGGAHPAQLVVDSTVPEPATLTVLVLASAAMLRRRK